MIQCSYLPMQDLEFAAVLSCKVQGPLETHLFQFVGS